MLIGKLQIVGFHISYYAVCPEESEFPALSRWVQDYTVLRTIAVEVLTPGQDRVNSPAELLSRPMFRSEFGT